MVILKEEIFFDCQETEMFFCYLKFPKFWCIWFDLTSTIGCKIV